MRLVDAEDLMLCITNEYNRHRTGDGLRLAWIEKAVNDAPTITPDMAQVLAYECGKDSVSVVRCKDCKYTNAHGTDANGNVDVHCVLFNLWMKGGFYCADGTSALTSEEIKARK